MHSALTRKIYIAFMKEERLRGHSDTSVLPCLHKVFGFKPRLRTLTALAIKCPLFSESVEPASFKQIWLNIFESKMNWFTTSNDQLVVCPVMKRPAAKTTSPRPRTLGAPKSELSVVPSDAFYAASRAKWRSWLGKNFKSKSYAAWPSLPGLVPGGN